MSHQQEQALSEHENGTDTELDESQYELDPVFLNSKREAIVIVAIFLAFGAFCIPVSYWLSKNDPSSTTLGIPSWVFWGNALSMDSGERGDLVFLLLVHGGRSA